MLLVAACTLVPVAAGCAAQDQPAPPAPTSTSDLPPLPPASAAPDSVGVSPGGVTTRVDVPADATESQYGQACRAAALWLADRDGEPAALAEAYLAELQAPGASGPGTFETTWMALTPAQQAGVVMAVNAAANDECG